MWCYLEELSSGSRADPNRREGMCVCGQCETVSVGDRVGSLLIASMNELNKSEGDHAGCLKREKM